MKDARTLLDEAAVIEVIVRLFVDTDRRDWAGVRACLADSVRFDMTSLAGGEPSVLTPGEIAGLWEAGLAPIEAVHHQAGNFQVQVNGEEASASCYGIAYHYRRTASGRNARVFVGSYDFHLVRRGEAWRIDAFKFNAKFVDGNLELERDEPA